MSQSNRKGLLRDFALATVLGTTLVAMLLWAYALDPSYDTWKRTRGIVWLEGDRPTDVEMYTHRLSLMSETEFNEILTEARKGARSEQSGVDELRSNRGQERNEARDACLSKTPLEQRKTGCMRSGGIRHQNPDVEILSETEFEYRLVIGSCYFARTRREARLNACID